MSLGKSIHFMQVMYPMPTLHETAEPRATKRTKTYHGDGRWEGQPIILYPEMVGGAGGAET